jgi:hypothetical protein
MLKEQSYEVKSRPRVKKLCEEPGSFCELHSVCYSYSTLPL